MDHKLIKNQLQDLETAIKLAEIPLMWRVKVQFYLGVVYLNHSCKTLAKASKRSEVSLRKNLVTLGCRLNNNAAFAVYMKRIINLYDSVCANKIKVA